MPSILAAHWLALSAPCAPSPARPSWLLDSFARQVCTKKDAGETNTRAWNLSNLTFPSCQLQFFQVQVPLLFPLRPAVARPQALVSSPGPFHPSTWLQLTIQVIWLFQMKRACCYRHYYNPEKSASWGLF